ncbi:MAG: GGDEF domain-containing protein [Cyanobacteria bacterium J06639_14]
MGQQDLLERIAQLETENKNLRYQLGIDPLTGIANRKAFDGALQREIARAVRSGSWLSLLLLDIDHFSRFNERHGHLGGDRALKQCARLWKTFARRSTDCLARYGGEEFAIILTDTDEHTTGANADDLVKMTADLSPVTVSVGYVSVIPTQDVMPETLIELADEALYKAKGNGRNRAVSAASLVTTKSA